MKRTRVVAAGLAAVIAGLAITGLQAGSASASIHDVTDPVVHNAGRYRLDPPLPNLEHIAGSAAQAAFAATGVFSEYAYDGDTEIVFGLLTETSRGTHNFLGQFIPASILRPVWAMVLDDVPVPGGPALAGGADVAHVGDVVVSIDAITGAFISAMVEGAPA